MADPTDNRRKLTRIPIHLRAELHLKGEPACHVRLENISFSGAGVYCEQMHTPCGQQDLRMVLVLNPEDNRFDINLHAQVVYTHKDGRIGLHFTGIDAESYRHFEHLMIFNSEHGDDLIRELTEHPGLEPSEGGLFAPIDAPDT
ncbi:PilZ domain-containing protein [Magnetococcus sp. PR-3]|uniref:PilZ domain-containing protein n=1 Tax=Magnetococcus sp. PR-3 TaxID=3120355 RepID=UPI002FCDF2DC